MAFTWANTYSYTDLTTVQFIADVRARLNEDTADLITDAQIQSFIKEGYNDIANRAGINIDYATLDLDGSTSYDLPANCGTVHSVNILTGTVESALTPVAFQDIGKMYGTPTYSIFNQKFVVSNGLAGTVKLLAQRLPTFGTYIDMQPKHREALSMFIEFMYFKSRRLELDHAQIIYALYKSAVERVAVDFGQDMPVASYGVGGYIANA